MDLTDNMGLFSYSTGAAKTCDIQCRSLYRCSELSGAPRIAASLTRRLVFFLLLYFVQVQPVMAAGPVWLLMSHAGSDYQQVADAFVNRLGTEEKMRIEVRVINAEKESVILASDKDGTGPGLIVAIGSTASRLAHAAPPALPVLDILIPRLLYEQLTPAGGSRSALYIDQPFERQLNLCRLIVPDLHNLAVLYGPTSQGSDSDLRRAAQQSDINLIARHVAEGGNTNAALDQVLEDSQLMLALPDPDVFTRYTVAGLLLTAYHHAVPVIGFSAAYVKAGALAAVYSTPEQIGRDAAEMVLAAHRDTGWSLPAPRYPAYYSVAVNRQVGRSLSLKLPDETDLQRSLAHQEQAPR
jgi:putative tryptophan/tyrosine transport system substrate-binding protein